MKVLRKKIPTTQDLQIDYFYKRDSRSVAKVAKAIGRNIGDIVKKEELVGA